MRIIGSKGIVLNKSIKRGKFEPKGDEYILVGYDNISKAYRVWKRSSKTVIKTRDVKFIEATELNKESIENTSAPIIKIDGIIEKKLEERKRRKRQL